MTWAPIALAAGGLLMQGVSMIQQSNAAKSASESAANASRYNAALETQRAQQARDAAAANETTAQLKGKLLISHQRAAAAAAGVDPNNGSPLELMTDTAQQTTLDALRIRYGGAVQSADLVNQAASDTFTAGRYEAAGAAAAAALPARLGATILTGGSQIYRAAQQPQYPTGP